VNVKVGVLRETHAREALSILDIPAADDTLAGALMGAADNNTTGKFTNQTFEAIDAKLNDGDDVMAALDALFDKGALFIIADLSAERLLAASERAKLKGAVLFNVSATDDRLREADCRANVIHVAPTRSMLADGLTHIHLETMAAAHQGRIRKTNFGVSLPQQRQEFGAKIVENASEDLAADPAIPARRPGGRSGPDAERACLRCAIAADERGFGASAHCTWDPRPVAGSGGLMPISWDHEQWGATAGPLHSDVQA
jgi:ABC transporter substrate binding protein (PQQ-dependent alcohol dehydrogenase system)